MRYLKVASCLAALFFSLSSLAAGAEVSYSGVPGKWKRGGKTAKDKATEAEPAGKEPSPEKGKRTMTVPAPTISVTPATPAKK